MNEQLFRILKKPGLIPIAVGVVSFGAGVGVGYLLGRRNKKEEVHDLPQQLKFDLNASKLDGIEKKERHRADIVMENAERYIQNHYRETGTVEPPLESDPDKVATPAEAFLLNHLPGTVVLRSEPDITHPIEATARSIFASKATDWDYDEEIRNRTEALPYILHRDEFYEDELGYVQATFTYYAGDDIMVDEDDAPVYNYKEVIGPLRFGHGCDDPNVFHVRNCKRKEEYEVVYDPGSYTVEVLGLEADEQQAQDLKHAKPRKFKLE